MPFPFLGFGVGLRSKHYETIVTSWPKVDFFEIISENFMIDGGRPLTILDQVKERYPLVMHGVSLSIGSTDPIRGDYLTALQKLAKRVQPVWISDHLCWTGVGGMNAHDLLPLPYTSEALKHVVKRIQQLQDFLDRQIAIENVSSYMSYQNSEMSEWEFLKTVSEEADCKILLDINNIYVSSVNHNFNATEYLENIPTDRVVQFHLAGHSTYDTHLLDTHDHPIKDEVWSLYQQAIQRFGAVSTLIERDDHIPELGELLEELAIARKIFDENETISQPSSRAAL